MATLEQLQAKHRAAIERASELRSERDKLKKAYSRGELDKGTYDQELKAIKALIKQYTEAAKKHIKAINDLAKKKKSDEDSEKSAKDSDDAQDKANEKEYSPKEVAAKAQELYSQADELLESFLLQRISSDRFETELAEINKQLKALDYLPWTLPTPEPEPEPEPAPPGATLDLSNLEYFMQKQGDLKDMIGNPELAAQMQSLIESSLVNQGVTDELIDSARSSPIDPEKASEAARAITLGVLGGVALAGSAVILAEAGSLGQLETPARVMQMIFGASGSDQLASKLAMIPFETGIMRGTQRHWNSVNQAELPGSGDLIKFLVRETISRETFEKAMKEQGFSPAWLDAYWVSHWREISRRDTNDAFHRGVITREERDKLLVILDFRPDARPGISKPDLEIIGSISKTLIPRVDLRRAFKLGLLDYEALTRSYLDLGYEEDAEMMSYIQANTGFEAAQNAVIREGGKLFQKGLITEADFLQVYTVARETLDDFTLWKYRYDLALTLEIGGEESDELTAEEALEEAAKDTEKETLDS